MPYVLSDQKVCHPVVPMDWKPVLDDLAEFVSLEQQLRAEPGNGQLIDRIRTLHDQLVEGSDRLLEPHALDDIDPQLIERMFARSVFLVTHIATSVAGDDEVLDTAGCRTLHLYEADFLADADHQRQMRETLCRCLSLTEDELHQVEQKVLADIQPAARKHRVVRAIRDEFGLWKESANLRENVFGFFDAIYPSVGIMPSEVELIVTGTMIFFCLPFAKDELTTERFHRLSTAEQQPIRDFLSRVNRFSQWQFAHFPVFGFRRGQDLDASLLQQIADRCELAPEVVASEISTLTAVIPLDELDKYVVHDIWGHSWQACMLGFDDHYERLASYADPLRLDEFAVESRGANTINFQDCFVGDGDSLVLDESLFRRFADLEVAERLPIAMTPVLAEVLADVAEFKLLDTGRTGDMSSSSALHRFPAKLDLTMRDVTFYFRQATKIFRLWAERDDRRGMTVDQLMNRGATQKAAHAAVERAAAIWRELEDDWLSPKMRHQEADGQLHVNVVSRLALNFLAIHRETLDVYRRIGQMPVGELPLKSLRDLMLIAVAVFFEESPSLNLWRVDEFLSLRIEPLCEDLVEQSQSWTNE